MMALSCRRSSCWCLLCRSHIANLERLPERRQRITPRDELLRHEAGETEIGGKLPINASGGVLSSNPIGASGMIRFAEAAVQVMGRAGDQPDLLLQPEDLLELFPLLAELKARCDLGAVALWPGNNVGYFGPYESTLRAAFRTTSRSRMSPITTSSRTSRPAPRDASACDGRR